MSKMVSLWDDAGIFKWHAVSEELVNDLRQDLEGREADAKLRPAPLPRQENGVAIVGLDLQGMAMMSRAYRLIQLDGVVVEIPSMDFESILADAKLKPRRVFASGKEYYKIHHYIYCLVLTTAQRDQLIAGMEAQRVEAETEADADNNRFLKAMREINQDQIRVVSARAMALEQAVAGKKGSN